MQLNPSPFELMTAATDFLLGVLVVFLFIQFSSVPGYRASIWKWFFILLAVASFLGVVAHGLDLTESIRSLVWHPLNLSLGLTLGLFVIGALYDLAGEGAARKLLPWMIALGFVFFGITVFIPGTFLIFIAYEASAMLFALGVYSYLSAQKSLAGAGLIAIGVLVTIIAAVVQATGQAGNSILWYFDNNGVFHLVQMVGLLLLFVGLKAGLAAES